MRGLKDKSIVVAGGATGIGAATAQRLGEEGARVLVGDINLKGAQATAERVRQAGGRAVAALFDLADDDSCRELLSRAVAEFGALDGLFNVAAELRPEIVGQDTNLVDVPVEIWKRTLDVNLTGYFYLCRHAIPVMREGRGGSIVNTLSGLAFYGDRTKAAYQVSKLGIQAMIRHIALVWGRDGIRCNGVAPGLVLTETALNGLSDEERTEIRSKQTAARNGKGEDLAAAAAFLLSDDAEWINGQVHMVNGGRW